MIRYKKPDQKNATSLLEASKREMEFTLSLKPSDKSASTIIRNVHESFRMLGDAVLISKGIETTDHKASIQELIKLNPPTKRPIQVVESLKQLRHNINYYGHKPSIAEADDALDIARACFKTTYDTIFQIIKKASSDKV